MELQNEDMHARVYRDYGVCRLLRQISCRSVARLILQRIIFDRRAGTQPQCMTPNDTTVTCSFLTLHLIPSTDNMVCEAISSLGRVTADKARPQTPRESKHY